MRFDQEYKAGDKFSYQSPLISDGEIGFEALRTINVDFQNSFGRISCMNMNFVTKI
jgi:hypothetical protein